MKKYLILLLLGCNYPMMQTYIPTGRTLYYFSLSQWRDTRIVHYIRTPEGKIVPFTDYQTINGTHFPERRKYRHDMVYVGYGIVVSKPDTSFIMWPLNTKIDAVQY